MLAELKEYATEVDVDFVRKAVRAIGRCAIKVEVGVVDFHFILKQRIWKMTAGDFFFNIT